jgi:CRP-like cAMP-binding protein
MDMHQDIKKKFPFLSDEKLEQILMLGDMLHLKEGEIFVRAGEKSYRGGLVIEGLMRNYTITGSGEEITELFAAEMQVITPYSTVLLDVPASETAAAVEQTILFVLDFRDFKKLALTDLVIMRTYVQMIEDSLVAAIQRIEDFTQRNPEQRYKRILDSQAFLIDRVPLKYLASYLGITAVSLSRIRKRVSQNRN